MGYVLGHAYPALPGLPDPPPPRVLDCLRHAMRARHFAIRLKPNLC